MRDDRLDTIWVSAFDWNQFTVGAAPEQIEAKARGELIEKNADFVVTAKVLEDLA